MTDLAVCPPKSRKDERARLAKAALDKWRDDPVAFAHDVLRIDGQPVQCWSRQTELLRAIPKHKRVSCRSGHKVGKSLSVAIAALWWVCTRRKGRVVLTSASYFQVEEVLWSQIRQLYDEAAVPIGGDMHELPASGLQFRDGRQIIGLSTKEPERMAGFSGANLLFIVDEASGVEDRIFDAIEGNRAGGAHVVMISNPTQLSGTFYESHTTKASYWKTLHISSEEVAREVPSGTGLANSEYIEEKRREWGPDYESDARYLVRIRGQFPRQGDDTMIGLGLVEDAIARYASTPGEGSLEIGVDVARYGTDESVIATRRGKRVFPLVVMKGFNVVQVAGKVLEVVRDHRGPNEKVTVRIDTSNMGGGVADILRTGDGSQAVNIDVVECMASSAATASGYSRLRDQVWGSFRDWLREGGALPDDPLLRDDAVAPKYGFDAQGRIKVESKLDMRKRIGRSTDRADAVALAVYQGGDVDRTDVIFSEFSDMPKAAW